MPNYRRPDNRNLFHFDIHTIEPVLSDANSLLTQNANEMIQLLLSLDLDQTEITQIKHLIKEAKFIIKQLADYRSMDARTFKIGKDKVDNFYKSYEKRIKSGLDRINEYLNNLVNEDNNNLAEEGIHQEDTNNIDPEVVHNFELDWEIESINADILDYNELKPYLSSYHVKLALNKHLKEFGPNQIEGVTYRRKVR